jgi:hypothetical protein
VRRIVATLVLALGFLGCSERPKAEQVPLVTVELQQPSCCWLFYAVVDVVADPEFGTVVKGSGVPLRWPTGYTGWRAGTEIKVMDAGGNVVLTTGSRYRIEPETDYSGVLPPDLADWVIGSARPCPGCMLESGPE